MVSTLWPDDTSWDFCRWAHDDASTGLKTAKRHDRSTISHCRFTSFGASLLNYFWDVCAASAWNCFTIFWCTCNSLSIPSALYQCPQTCKWLYVDLTFFFSHLYCALCFSSEGEVLQSDSQRRGNMDNIKSSWKNKKTSLKTSEKLMLIICLLLSFVWGKKIMRGMCFWSGSTKKRHCSKLSTCFLLQANFEKLLNKCCSLCSVFTTSNFLFSFGSFWRSHSPGCFIRRRK